MTYGVVGEEEPQSGVENVKTKNINDDFIRTQTSTVNALDVATSTAHVEGSTTRIEAVPTGATPSGSSTAEVLAVNSTHVIDEKLAEIVNIFSTESSTGKPTDESSVPFAEMASTPAPYFKSEATTNSNEHHSTAGKKEYSPVGAASSFPDAQSPTNSPRNILI